MRRFTILSLMGVVLALALALAALRGADDNWAGGLLLATPLLCGVGLIGARFGRERSRASRTGFAVIGGGYFALAFLGLSDGNLAKLPTTRLLQFAHERVIGPVTYSVVFSTLTTSNQRGVILTQDVSKADLGVAVSAATVQTGGPSPANSVTLAADSLTLAAPVNTWKVLLPGAANRDSFNAVGHCLFALLAGLLGAFIAGRFEKQRLATIEQSPV